MVLVVSAPVAGPIRLSSQSSKKRFPEFSIFYFIFRDGDWVHVYGTFKAHGNSKSITIAAMRKIVDFNEVTYHFLEAITAHKIASDPSFLVRR